MGDGYPTPVDVIDRLENLLREMKWGNGEGVFKGAPAILDCFRDIQDEIARRKQERQTKETG